MRFLRRLPLPACLALLASCASSSDCACTASPQATPDCHFANPPDSATPPGASGWKI